MCIKKYINGYGLQPIGRIHTDKSRFHYSIFTSHCPHTTCDTPHLTHGHFGAVSENQTVSAPLVLRRALKIFRLDKLRISFAFIYTPGQAFVARNEILRKIIDVILLSLKVVTKKSRYKMFHTQDGFITFNHHMPLADK
jgi:hypothetical protein